MAGSTHWIPFDAGWLWCGTCNSIKRIEKPILEFILQYNGKGAKTYSWTASIERLCRLPNRELSDQNLPLIA